MASIATAGIGCAQGILVRVTVVSAAVGAGIAAAVYGREPKRIFQSNCQQVFRWS